ncbi:hypothetical protein QBC36DRAFT_234488 [Triangularia setosa]|uniref:Uncharacterized protein n=1 Tax=Triangularia setosa TaxID=2587417 RepID=A0AAN6WAG0_9PEZI|nr:hypothetical protein QBC36DRAFT_234488 [Podospora setosa]
MTIKTRPSPCIPSSQAIPSHYLSQPQHQIQAPLHHIDKTKENKMSLTVTQFTPAPSCGIGKALYAVEKTCYMYAGDPTPTTVVAFPTWLPECTAVQVGEPYDKMNPDCYAYWSFRAGVPTNVIYAPCGPDYTTATSSTYHPFYRSVEGGGRSQMAVDVVAKNVICCPRGDVKYTYNQDGLEPSRTRTAVVEGTTWSGVARFMPHCRGTMTGGRRTVTLSEYRDTQAWERKRDEEGNGVKTEVWEGGKEVWAAMESYYATVFADGHTCYTDCSKYWSESYTSPTWVVSSETTKVEESEAVTTTTTTSEGESEVVTTAGPVTLPGPGTAPGTGGLTAAPTQTALTPVPNSVAMGRGCVRAGLLAGLMGVVVGLLV